MAKRKSFKVEPKFKANSEGEIEEYIYLPLDGGYVILDQDRKVVTVSEYSNHPHSYYNTREMALIRARDHYQSQIEYYQERIEHYQKNLERLNK